MFYTRSRAPLLEAGKPPVHSGAMPPVASHPVVPQPPVSSKGPASAGSCHSSCLNWSLNRPPSARVRRPGLHVASMLGPPARVVSWQAHGAGAVASGAGVLFVEKEDAVAD